MKFCTPVIGALKIYSANRILISTFTQQYDLVNLNGTRK
ncbi:MAG: hypothetical protein JWQ38_921 [Flavipsychrobacter sp.]|nr:hypothetical protein [Flavipsychrobacter sp.]